MPKRIQRKRTKGWKMPANAVYVGRPTKWGNPYIVGRNYADGEHDEIWYDNIDAQTAVHWFEEAIMNHLEFMKFTIEDVRKELRGKDLVCWCDLDQPCHADVLLKILNQEPDPGVYSLGYDMKEG